ncbi:FxSxx-COOH system tetratricopeptide repeat protein, partial [Streptomonospora algeriensis]
WRSSPRDRVRAFRSAASPTAFKLACYLAAAPLSLPVMRLVQEAMLPESTGAHLAEVLLSGLVRTAATGADGPSAAASGEPAAISYSYDPEIADTLISYLRRDEAYRVFQRASDALDRHVGSPDDFAGMLAVSPGNADSRAGKAFATVGLRVLRALGGEYSAVAERLSADFPANAALTALPPTTDPHRGPTGSAPAEPPRATADGRAARDPLDDTSRSPYDASGAPVDTPTDRAQPPQPDAAERVGSRPVIMNHVPKPNPNFTGREDLLLNLRGRIKKTTTTLVPFALHGMGGVGKSQAAVEFVHRFRGDYDLVWWIDAEQPEQVRASLVELAERLGLSTVGGTGETVARVLDHLRRGVPYANWLLIFDNAVYSPDTMECVPDPTGDVLITSRDHGWSRISDIVEVDVLHREESVELLTRRAGHVSAEDAEKIAHQLGDLPLALEQAAAWLAQTGMTAAEYLDLLSERQSELLAAETLSGYPGTVLTSLSVSIEEVRRVDPGAAELLMLCAYFSSDPVARRMLLRGGRDLDDPLLSDVLSDRLRFSRTVRTLHRFALATIHPDEEALSIHRLARTLMREMGTPEERSARRRHAQTILTRANPGDPDDRDNWSAIGEIARHVLGSDLVHNPALPARKTVLDVIRLRYVRGDAQASKRLAEFVVDTWREQHGPDDRHTLMACFGLANALRQLSDYACIDLNTDTLQRMRRVLGEEDEQTLLATNSHGADLRRQNRLDQALELDERNHERHVRVFGRDHRATQRVANNLALDLRLHGRFEEARDLDRESLRIRAETYGPTHDRALYSANQLSRDLRATGEYSEALQEIEGVMPTYEATLGRDHPDVIDARLGLAHSLRRMGRLDDAFAQAERCVADAAAEPRLHYESVLAARWVMADVLRLRGEPGRALEYGQEAVRGAEDHFGPEHILTTIYRNNHSIILTHRGEHEESLRVNTEVAERIELWRGRRHAYFLAIEANLASDRYHLGEVQEALRISDVNLRVSVEVRGESHPRTQFCRFNHALDLREAGYAERAEAENDHAYRELVRMFGPDHPEVAGVAAGERQQFDIEPPIM